MQRVVDALTTERDFMTIGVPKETAPGERRVALVPGALSRLTKEGIEVLVEAGAGEAAYHADVAYEEKGARVVDRAAAFQADVVAKVQSPSDEELAEQESEELVEAILDREQQTKEQLERMRRARQRQQSPVEKDW